MLHIEHMRMQLPAGFEHRAASIARLVGDAMGKYRATENQALDRLSIGPVQISPNATDQEIAHSIAERITVKLGGGL